MRKRGVYVELNPKGCANVGVPSVARALRAGPEGSIQRGRRASASDLFRPERNLIRWCAFKRIATHSNTLRQLSSSTLLSVSEGFFPDKRLWEDRQRTAAAL